MSQFLSHGWRDLERHYICISDEHICDVLALGITDKVTSDSSW